jgi:hypothetical protein
MLFQQIGEFPDQATALGSGHAAPWTVVESVTCRPHSMVDVFAITFSDLRKNLTGGWVVCGKSLTGRGIHPSSVD